MNDKEKIEAFKLEYREKMLKMKGIHEVHYFGSTEETDKWVSGKSDLDILVYGNNIPSRTKIYGVLLIEKLNNKLNLKLDDVTAGHPTPIYLDSPQRLLTFKLIQQTRFITNTARIAAKSLLSREKLFFNYRTLWNAVKIASFLEHLPFPLTPCKFL